MTLSLTDIWSNHALKRRLMQDPRRVLQKLGIAIPPDIAIRVLGSRGAPSDRDDTLLQFVLEQGPVFAYFFMPSPSHPSAQQAAYGRTISTDTANPAFTQRLHEDAQAALRRLGVALRPDLAAD